MGQRFYAIYTCGKISGILDKVLPDTPGISRAMSYSILITETFLIAYGSMRIKRFADLGTKVISYYLYFIGALMTIEFNSFAVDYFRIYKKIYAYP